MPHKDLIKRKEYQDNYRKVNRQRLNKHAKQYRRSPNYVAPKEDPLARKLRRIKQRCTDRNSLDYKWYGAKGIECHLTVEDLNYLFERDNAHTMKRPSVDRKDSKGHYTVENCRIIEHVENCRESQLRRWQNKRLPSLGDLVVTEGWGIGKVVEVDFIREFPYRVIAYHSGFLVPLKAKDVRLATDTEILAARLQGICPSLTS